MAEQDTLLALAKSFTSSLETKWLHSRGYWPRQKEMHFGYQDEVAAFSWLLATTPRDALRLLGEVATFSWLFAKNENSELSYKGKLRVPLSHPPFLPSLI